MPTAAVAGYIEPTPVLPAVAPPAEVMGDNDAVGLVGTGIAEVFVGLAVAAAEPAPLPAPPELTPSD